MTRNLFSDRSNPSPNKKIPFPQNYSYSTLYDNYLIKILEENKALKISKEIKSKKQQITTMFRNKFGRDFLTVKPDSVILFEKLFGQCLFHPDSQFLAHFPKLRKKLLNERKISELKLKAKIDMGAMLLYDLTGKGKKKTQYLDRAKEKRFAVSKNFESKATKDVVQSEYYQKIFWEKNKEKIRKYYEKNNIRNSDDFFDEENVELIGWEGNNGDGESSIEKKEENENDSNTSLNNSNIKNFKENNNIDSYRFSMEKANRKDSKENKKELKLNLQDDDNNEIKNKEAKNSISKTITKKGEKIISSFKNKNIESKFKLNNINNKSRNINNLFGIFGNSTTFKNASYNISYSKINESNSNNSNFINTMNNFNLSTKGFQSKLNNYKKHLSKSIFQKKKIISLKNKHYKFKDKLSNQIIKLNQCTNKCNSELIKLIDINNDDNYAEKKKKYKNRNKLDIKGLLIDKKEEKHNESDSDMDNEEKEAQTEKLQETEKITIKSILEGARIDLKNKFGGKLVPQNKEKMLKRKINHISDEQALGMVDDFIEKQKELDVRKILGTDPKLIMKKKKRMNLLRLKTKENYDKMVRLKNQIIIDKRKIFRELGNIDIN